MYDISWLFFPLQIPIYKQFEQSTLSHLSNVTHILKRVNTRDKYRFIFKGLFIRKATLHPFRFHKQRTLYEKFRCFKNRMYAVHMLSRCGRIPFHLLPEKKNSIYIYCTCTVIGRWEYSTIRGHESWPCW